MGIYFASMIISCLFTYLGTRKNDKYLNIWIVLAIVIPCIVAGARDTSIGTDTMTYIVPLKNYANQVPNLARFMLYGNAEPGFLLYVYFVTKWTNHLFWICFGIELFCMVFVYLALRDNGVGKYTWIGMLVFHLMFYSFTLNLVRQFMGLSVGLYSFKYIKSRKWKTYCFISILLTILIHRISFILLFIYPIYWLSVGKTESTSIIYKFFRKYRKLSRILIIFGACTVVLFAAQIITIVSVLFNRFQGQVENIKVFSITWTNLLFMFPFVIIFFMYRRPLIEKNPDFGFYNLALIISVILWQLQGLSKESYRVTFYFQYFLVLMIPLCIKNIRVRSNRFALLCIFTISMVAYYINYFVINLYNETYPYTSKLLGIE